MSRVTPPEDIDHAVDLYVSGQSREQVRATTGVSESVLYRALQARGIPAHSRRIDLPIEEVIDLFLAGMSIKALGLKYKADRGTIRRRIEEAGIATRDRSQAMQVRWSHASGDERATMLAAAHEAARGRQVTDAERVKQSAGRAGRPMSSNETFLATLLGVLGLSVELAVPCGKYNIDIVADGSVAVEVFGGDWHSQGNHRARFGERSRHILDAGYSLVIVWVNQRRYELDIRAANEIRTLVEITRGHPSIGRQHWVIRGDGHFLAAREDDGQDVPFVLSSGRRDD